MATKAAKTAKTAKGATGAKTGKGGPSAAKPSSKPRAKAKPAPAPAEPAVGWGETPAWEAAEPAAAAGPPAPLPPPVQVVSWGTMPPSGWTGSAGSVGAAPIAMRPTRGLAGALVVLLGIAVGFAAANLLALFLVEDWGSPGAGTGMVVLEGLLSTASLGASIALVVVFCLWLYRTLSNAAARFPLAGINPGWAVGSFFVPLAHLILPYFEVVRAWRADVSPDPRPVASWFIPWAFSILASYVTGVVAVSIAFRTVFADLGSGTTDTTAIYEEMRPLQLVAGSVSLVLQALAAYFLARLVRQWTDHQEGPPVS